MAPGLESLEAISRDHDTRTLFLRMAHLSQNGRLQPFLRELEDDRELDAETKGTSPRWHSDETFLHAVDDYVHRTRLAH